MKWYYIWILIKELKTEIMKLFALVLIGTLLYSCSSTEQIIKEEVNETSEQIEDAAMESTKPEKKH